MYHEQTYDQQKRTRRTFIVRAVIVVALVAACALMVMGAQASAREQAAMTVRESVLTAAKQCCAVEGSYPTSIAHLEEYYGLVVNRSDYVISYECFAGNVLPSVVVTVR